MDTLDFVWKLVESQGLVATMLAFLIWQNSREKTQLLHKICELNHFIMKCLENELNEEHLNHNGSGPNPSQQERHNSSSEVELPGLDSAAGFKPL